MHPQSTNPSSARPTLAPRPKSTSSIFRLMDLTNNDDRAGAARPLQSNPPTTWTASREPIIRQSSATTHHKNQSTSTSSMRPLQYSQGSPHIRGQSSISTLSKINTASSAPSTPSSDSLTQPITPRLTVRRRKSGSIRQTFWRVLRGSDEEYSHPSHETPARVVQPEQLSTKTAKATIIAPNPPRLSPLGSNPTFHASLAQAAILPSTIRTVEIVDSEEDLSGFNHRREASLEAEAPRSPLFIADTPRSSFHPETTRPVPSIIPNDVIKRSRNRPDPTSCNITSTSVPLQTERSLETLQQHTHHVSSQDISASNMTQVQPLPQFFGSASLLDSSAWGSAKIPRRETPLMEARAWEAHESPETSRLQTPLLDVSAWESSTAAGRKMEAASLAARVMELEQRMAVVENSLQQLNRKKNRKTVVINSASQHNTDPHVPKDTSPYVTPGEFWLQSRKASRTTAEDSPPSTPTLLPSSIELDATPRQSTEKFNVPFFSATARIDLGIDLDGSMRPQANAYRHFVPTPPTGDATSLLEDLKQFRQDLADVSKDIGFGADKINATATSNEHPRTLLVQQRRLRSKKLAIPPSRLSAYDTNDDYDNEKQRARRLQAENPKLGGIGELAVFRA